MKFFTFIFIFSVLIYKSIFSQVCLVGNKSYRNINNTIKLTKQEARDIFLLKKTQLEGKDITLVALRVRKEEEELFFNFLGLDIRSLVKIWLKETYSGKSNPPVTVKNFDEMKIKIEEIPYSIGYLPKQLVTENLIILYETE